MKLNIQNVWAPELINQGQPNPTGFNQPSSQPNPMQQNKIKIDIIVHHLQVFKYPFTPKPNVFQNMTQQPKYWLQMLQILDFFSNLVRVSIHCLI
jgi:hypothetical protein